MSSNNKGFSQILLITVLPLIIGAFGITYSIAGIIQLNTRIQSLCRKDQIQAQNEIRKLLTKLFQKNPRASYLRAELLKAQAALIVARTTANPPLIATLEGRIQYLNYQRLTLDLYQKSLITAANLLIAQKTTQIYLNTTRELRSIQLLQPLFHTAAFAQPSLGHKLPVVPKYPDIAPTYVSLPNFSERQALVQKWQYSLKTRDWLAPFVTTEASFQKTCSTSLEEDGDSWTITTKEDKF